MKNPYTVKSQRARLKSGGVHLLNLILAFSFAISCQETVENEFEHIKSGLGGVYSPDGKRIAFYAYTEDAPGQARIYTMNTDGSGIERITYDDLAGMHAEPHWSPDGKEIAFTNFVNDGAVVVKVNVATKEITHLKSLGETGFHMFSSWGKRDNDYYFFYWPNGGFNPNSYYFNGNRIVQLTSDSISLRPTYIKGSLIISKIVDYEQDKYQAYKFNSESNEFEIVEGLEQFFLHGGEYHVKEVKHEDKIEFILEDLDGNDIRSLGEVPFNSVFFPTLNNDLTQVLFSSGFEYGNEIFALDINTGEQKKIIGK